MPAKIATIPVSDLRGYVQLSVDAAIGVTNLTQQIHQTVLDTPGPFGAVARGLTGGIASLVYRGVRGGLHMGGAGADWLLSKLVDQIAPESSPNRDIALAALNGIYGDQLAAKANPLAIAMQLFSDGRPLTLEKAALAAALAHASGRVAVLAHGLCMSDHAWRGADHDLGAELAHALGFTPIYLRYNASLHISVNGRAFAEMLETLTRHWPTQIDELVIIGHSMGGLVARSACFYGEAAGHSWRRRLSSMFFLGTPHHGAPLEQLGAWVDHFIGKIPYAAAFGRIGKARSVGVTDLRFGSLIDEDWLDRDRFGLSGDDRRPIPLPEGVDCFAIAATMASASNTRLDGLVGDGLVPVASALGEHPDPARRLAFDPDRQWIGKGMNHFDLLSRREVSHQITRWLRLERALEGSGDGARPGASRARRLKRERVEQIVAVRRDVGQGKAVERVQKNLRRPQQRRTKPAARDQGAGRIFRVETFDHVETFLGAANHLAHRDRFRPAREPEAAAIAAKGLDIAPLAELMDATGQMRLGDAEGVRDIADRGQGGPACGGDHQDPQGEIGIARQLHGETLRQALQAVILFHSARRKQQIEGGAAECRASPGAA
jgi:pimeloyl-ACP methyl ester carboxylesterase